MLSVSQQTELICATLSTLHAFLSWIPLGYIFESPLVGVVFCLSNTALEEFWNLLVVCLLQLETLLNFFPIHAYQNLTLQCLTEVCSIVLVLMLLPETFMIIIIYFLCSQVAALQFGNYYDAHIKMYNIFMGQLQVCLNFE